MPRGGARYETTRTRLRYRGHESAGNTFSGIATALVREAQYSKLCRRCPAALRGPEKNLAGTKGPAKFEQGGFTSTRRRVRRPLSGRKSRKLVWSKPAPEIRSDQVSPCKTIQLPVPNHNRELVLARLQKPQCYEQGIELRAGRSGGPLPEPPFGDLAQQEIAENADPLR